MEKPRIAYVYKYFDQPERISGMSSFMKELIPAIKKISYLKIEKTFGRLYRITSSNKIIYLFFPISGKITNIGRLPTGTSINAYSTLPEFDLDNFID